MIFGSGFGASQNGSVATLNGLPLTVETWSDTAIQVTIPSGATTGHAIVSVAPTMNDSNYVVFTVTSQPLAPGWLDSDVGQVGNAGTATYANGTFTVNGGGDWYFQEGSDAMHFAYQPLSGDGSIIARIVSRSTSSTVAGVMIRETLQANSRFASMEYNSYPYFVYRTSTGGSSTYANHSSVTLPYWVELVRSGSSFTSYVSPDGVNWTQVGTTQTISMATNVYIGLAAASNSTTALANATFDNVSINSALVPAPVITSMSATTGAVGTPVTISGSGFGTSQSGSMVVLNGTSLPVTAWSSSSISVTIPSGATSGPLLVSVAPSMNDSNYVIFTVELQPLPTGWDDADIGSVGTAGSSSFSAGVFTVNGAGDWYFQEGSDAMHFVYQPLSGDGSIVARIVSRSTTSTNLGVMIRETLQANSRSVSAEYNTYPYFVYRASTGASSSYNNLNSVSLPYWVKLVRSTNTFSAYASPDDVTWTQIGSSQTITMASNVFVGLAVASDTSSLANGTFDNVVITSGEALPTVTGVSPSSGAASTSVTVYGASFGSTQGTSTLTFDGASPASITSWSNNQIVAIVPTTIQTGPVVVTVNSVQSNSNVIFTAFNPTITSLSPPSAPISGQVVAAGYGFGGATGTVSVNGTQAAIDSWSDTNIVFTVPQNATTGPVTVTMDGYTSNGVQLTIIEPLSITSISPTAGEVGSVVTISGTGFGSVQSDSLVTFDGVPASTVTSWSDTSLQAVVPSGAATGPVTVEVAGVTADGPEFQLDLILQLTDSLGHQSTYTSEMVGGSWYVSQSQGPGCSTCTLRGNNTLQYDAKGNIVSATDPMGYVTSSAYDSNNNLTQLTQPTVSGGTPVTTYTYNSFGEVLTMTDPLGHVTTNTYDTHGNLLTVTTPPPNNNTAASVTQFVYNPLGELTSISDPLGNLTKITYTPQGYVSTITDAQDNVTTYGYDSRGNRTSVTDAMSNTTTYTYDSGNRLTQITYPDSTTMSFGYDYRGRRTSVTDQNGKVTTYAYDDADRLTSVTDANNNVTQYGYDTESNLVSITDANGHITSFQYDASGNVTQTTFPSTLVETYQHDADNNLTSKTDRKNQTIQYVYDALNRLTQKTYPDTTTAEYTYDLVGKILSANDPSGSYGFAYDNMGRLIGTTTTYSFLSATTFRNSYSYDADSNRIGYTAPDNSTNTYTYDTLNRLSTLANSWAGSFGFSYDGLNRRTQMTRPNNVTTNYSYDKLSHLLSVLHQLAGSTIDGATYTVDNAGNRTAKTDDLANVTTTYNYDPIYELLSATQGVTTESYTYDPVGNRLSSLGLSPYNYNTSNELSSTPNASYTYDNNGNTTSKTNSSGTTSYTWDYENRLTNVTLPNGGGTVSFKYDPFGRRIYKQSPTATSIFAYDGDNLVETVNGSSGEVARYAQGQNIDEPLAMGRSGTVDYYEQDGLGSTTSLTNGTGTVAQTYTYDSFGNTTNSTGSLTNFFRYTAREFDTETGLYYYRARYYDPATGRFASEDPSRFNGGVNSYSYVLSNPIMLTDPFGLCWIYQQSTGNLYYNPYVFAQTPFSPFFGLNFLQPTIYSSSSTYIGQGYSGVGSGWNNPIEQDYSYQGPPPQGYYTIGPMLPKGPGKTGKNVMQLTPDPGTMTWGRTGFFIHGDTSCRCNEASEGCIILGPDIRDKIAHSPDKCLEVVQ